MTSRIKGCCRTRTIDVELSPGDRKVRELDGDVADVLDADGDPLGVGTKLGAIVGVNAPGTSIAVCGRDGGGGGSGGGTSRHGEIGR